MRRPARPVRAGASREGSLILAGLAVASPLAWALARSGLYTPGSDLGYWLGVAGACVMLLLFAYPLRKRWRVLGRVGSTRAWFVLHMVCGLAGPLLIVLHSTLHLRSLNALVAFCAMSVVAISGLAGRYLYAGLHRGSAGHRMTRHEAESLAQENLMTARHWLALIPEVLEELQRYGSHVDHVARQGLRNPLALFLLGFRARRMTGRCVRFARRWPAASAAPDEATRREREQQGARLAARARRLAGDYARAARRAAQYETFARLFGYWHVAHVPLVIVLVLTAIAHVIAVHMY
jgi:hypothetical protein